jgi:hypothetical protein
VMLAPAAGLGIVMLLVASRGYAFTAKVPGVHVRYLLGGSTGVAVVMAVGLGALAVRAGVARWLGPTVLGVGLVVQAWAWRSAVGTFWGSPGESTLERLDDLAAWSTWPPAVVGVVMVGAVAVAAWAMVGQIRFARAAPDARGRPDGGDNGTNTAVGATHSRRRTR